MIGFGDWVRRRYIITQSGAEESPRNYFDALATEYLTLGFSCIMPNRPVSSLDATIA